jgi:hypothetical protein
MMQNAPGVSMPGAFCIQSAGGGTEEYSWPKCGHCTIFAMIIGHNHRITLIRIKMMRLCDIYHLLFELFSAFLNLNV